MRNHYFLIFLLVLSSCAVKKEPGDDDKQVIPPPTINCPENGNCSFEVFKDALLKLSYDDHGKLYPEIISGNQTVVKYQYSRKTEEDVMDANYDEYVYLEFDPDEQQIILQDKDLQKVKMIFGRICYCKGSMGYFPVHEGNLFLFNKGGNLQLRTSFNVKKIPQVIKEIDENINY